jgi:hypothetical protein
MSKLGEVEFRSPVRSRSAVICVRALSWRRSGLFRLTDVGRKRWSSWCILSIS